MALKRYFLVAACCCIAAPAMAGNDTVRHDRKLEQAAAKRASGKLGELRGSISHADKQDVFYEEKIPIPLGFGRAAPRRRAGEEKPLPPMVMNEIEADGIDYVITGSNHLSD